jgi:hypothetical protein
MVLTVISILVGSILVGAVLAWRFTAFVLIPAVALDLAFVVAAGVAQGNDVWSTVLVMVLSAVGLQLGYLAGTATLHAFAFARTYNSALASVLTGRSR